MKAVSKFAPVDVAAKNQLSIDFDAKPKAPAKRLVKRLRPPPQN
jgi:hypothetical protein